MFWQLTIDASDPATLARFWAQALGYQSAPPAEPKTTWHAHYRSRLGDDAAFQDRLFDPAGLRPPIWFQEVPEAKERRSRHDDPQDPIYYAVMHDPEGNEFCIS
jgi:hypothetical protein